ncbi:TrmH family RNA methyltransferase [Streptomyces sp. NPDC057743]|uniref:TrmH family RNA methyltransferase n=1 Tax=Streptomyces sp. NPDC057743 TaxID=3346236 RepID=UPI0036A1BB73
MSRARKRTGTESNRHGKDGEHVGRGGQSEDKAGGGSAGPVVSSVKDERLAAVRALGTRAGRAAAGACVLEGRALIDQVLAAGTPLLEVLRAEGAAGAEDEGLARRLRDRGVVVHRVRDGVLRQVAGTARPVAWLALAALPADAEVTTPWGDFALVCDGVADPGNLGTLVRSGRALGIEDVVLTDATTDVTSRRVLDASRGTVLTTRTRRFESPSAAVAALRAAGFQIVATSPRGRQLQALAPLDGRPVALVVGGETAGVSQEVIDAADLLVAIPMAGAVESLNVGVAAGISLYELRTKMVLAVLTERIRNSLGRDVTLTGRFIRDALDRAAREAAGLSSAQVIALMVVTAEQHTPGDELRRDLGVDAGELDALMAPLTERGWLERQENAYLRTAAGEQALAALWPIQQQVEQQLLTGLSADERQTLRELLGKIRANAARCMDS